MFKYLSTTRLIGCVCQVVTTRNAVLGGQPAMYHSQPASEAAGTSATDVSVNSQCLVISMLNIIIGFLLLKLVTYYFVWFILENNSQ